MMPKPIKVRKNGKYSNVISVTKNVRPGTSWMIREIVDPEYSKKKIQVISKKPKSKYLFCWDNVPGKDNVRLIEYLEQKYGVDWVRTAKIEKIDKHKIRVATEKNVLSLKLNTENTNVTIIINKIRTDEFIVMSENSKLNIYKKESKEIIDYTTHDGRLIMREKVVLARKESSSIVLTMTGLVYPENSYSIREIGDYLVLKHEYFSEDGAELQEAERQMHIEIEAELEARERNNITMKKQR